MLCTLYNQYFEQGRFICALCNSSISWPFQIKKVLNIGCSYGSYLAYLLSRNFTSLCVSPYQEENNQVQLTLDRGLPAMIASPLTKQFPFPAASFNMIHCADCGIDWSQKSKNFYFHFFVILKPMECCQQFAINLIWICQVL